MSISLTKDGLASPDGAIQHSGDNLIGEGPGEGNGPSPLTVESTRVEAKDFLPIGGRA